MKPCRRRAVRYICSCLLRRCTSLTPTADYGWIDDETLALPSYCRPPRRRFSGAGKYPGGDRRRRAPRPQDDRVRRQTGAGRTNFPAA